MAQKITRLAAAAMLLCCCSSMCPSAYADDVSAESLSYDGLGRRLLLQTRGLSNSDDCTTVRFSIECQDVSFTIDSLHLVVNDTVYRTLSPFRFSVGEREARGTRQLWKVSARFPQLFEFTDDDRLQVYSSEGTFDLPLTQTAKQRAEAEKLYDEVTSLHSSEASQRLVMLISIAVSLLSIIAAIVSGIVFRRRYRRKTAAAAVEASHLQERLEAAHNELAGERKELLRSRFAVFNSLCNEYFEKGDSEITRATLVGDIEKVLLSYQSASKLAELQGAVNANIDGILTRIEAQIPALTESDLRFLSYLYAGFSPRAVCLMTDSKLKNFYNRRTRLKERILASGTADARWFAEEMQPSGT